MFRKVIRIRAEDSPNVRYALAQIAKGIEPTNEILVPGVLPYNEYRIRRATWDDVRQCVGLDGAFYEGAGALLFPPDWLNKAESYASTLPRVRNGVTMGVDCAEGGDKSAWAICDFLGLIHLTSEKTPDTTVVPAKTKALIQQFNIKPENVHFDRGGGGYEHVCTLKRDGFNVNAIGFGEAAVGEPSQFFKNWDVKEEERHERYVYVNRRAQIYHSIRLRLDPASGVQFGIPAEYTELRRQLAPMPLLYDQEGRIRMLPKRKKPNAGDKAEKSLEEILGCSPDEADAFALAVWGLIPGLSGGTLKLMF